MMRCVSETIEYAQCVTEWELVINKCLRLNCDNKNLFTLILKINKDEKNNNKFSFVFNELWLWHI